MNNFIGNMSLHNILRILILALIALSISSVVADYLTQDSLSASLRDNYYSEFFKQYPALSNSMGVALVGAELIALMGLWRRWNPARYIYFIALAATCAITPLLGPSISTAWGETFEVAAAMVAGGILVLIFFTDLRLEFMNGVR